MTFDLCYLKIKSAHPKYYNLKLKIERLKDYGSTTQEIYRFQIKELLRHYLTGEIKRGHTQKILGIGKRRFFQLVKKYREDSQSFSVEYKREKTTRKIDEEVEDNILVELKKEKDLIDSPDNPVKGYNYSYIKDLVLEKYGNKVSIPTIISRAKKYGFYKKRKKTKAHDREVITNYVGELVQHD